jgi:hypothetical protein
MAPNTNGAVTSAVLVHLRVEPAHFDWRWRERPALALLVWEALVRGPSVRLRRIQVESTGTKINFRPAAITHRDIRSIGLTDRIQRAADTSQKQSSDGGDRQKTRCHISSTAWSCCPG